jgi:hypothetical protein
MPALRVLRHQREGSLSKRVCDDAKKHYGLRSLQLNLRQDAGWPDRVYLIPGGRPLFLEFKRAGEDARPLQAHHIELLRGLGYDVWVADTYEDAMAIIDEALAKGL